MPFFETSDYTRITNEIFLETLFGADWPRVKVVHFAGDPEGQPRSSWKGYPAGDMLRTQHGHLNTYFSVSVQEGEARSLGGFEKICVIVLDDVGTKVDLAAAERILGCPPTYVLETSPGNCQAGWKVEPITSREWAQGLVVALYEALGQRGDNLTNLVGLMRLPFGVNAKAKLKTPWRVKMKVWNPHIIIRALDWPAIERRIGGVTPIIQGGAAGAASGSWREMPDPAEVESDGLLQAFRLLGLVQGTLRRMTFGWGFDVDCPWIGEHSERAGEGASYVPIHGRFHCHHGHCQERSAADVRVRLDELLRESGVGISTAAFDFDEIDPESVPLPRGRAHPFSDDDPIDLWDDKVPPEWPGGVLPGIIEDTLFELAIRDGLDLGALGATMITAASGAADKRHLLQPYAGSPEWLVRPVLWLMLVAESGLRKTAILAYLLTRLRRLNAERMRSHARAMAEWRALPRAERAESSAPEAAPLLAEDVTVERLQEWMSGNPRGLLYMRDELAALFGFGRYSNGGGEQERGFLLETYEGGPHTIGRMNRTTVIDNCSLSMLGATQPERIAEFKDLAHDGFISRFGVVVMQGNSGGVETGRIADVGVVNATIDQLLRNGAFDVYRTSADGEAVIRALERQCAVVAARPDIGVGFKGFIRKLHGTAARTALILHLMDGGDEEVIPVDTLARAELYARFLFMHAEVFYAGLPGSPENIARAIGSFLIRNPRVTRVTAGRLRRDVALCKPLRTLREIQDALFPLVTGGWLKPMSPWPTNNAWQVRPDLMSKFTERTIIETKRVDDVKDAMNWLGRYR